jgi:hypothetical protein
MRSRILTAAAVLAATFAASACDGGGDGAGTGPNGSAALSQAELAVLNRAILGVGTGVAQTGAQSQVSASRSEANSTGSGTFSFDFNTTNPCAPSGSVASVGTLGGSWNAQAQTGSLNAAVAVRHQACAVRANDGGVITLDGDPDIDVTLTATSNAGGLTGMRITETGAFNWSKGAGNSGRCTVDLTAELVPATGQVRLTGTFCGWNVTGVTESAG